VGGVTYTSVNIGGISLNVTDITTILSNTTSPLATTYLNFVNTTLTNALTNPVTIVNGVAVQGGSVTIDSTALLAAFISTFNFDNAQVTIASASVPGNGNIDFQGVVVVTNGLTLNIGTISIPVATLIPLLPNNPAVYYITFPAPYTVLHNSSSPHGFAAMRGQLLQAFFSECLSNPGFVYNARNHPLPLTTRQTINIKIIIALLTSIFILIPLCYIPSAFIVFLVKERYCISVYNYDWSLTNMYYNCFTIRLIITNYMSIHIIHNTYIL
jgi:hypothetical protein